MDVTTGNGQVREWLTRQGLEYVFVTVSGAHLYGFPSPDSDIDLRGAHLLPIDDVIGLHEPVETRTRTDIVEGVEVDFVSHDLRKFLQLLTKKNGYALEQVLSPHVVIESPLLGRLRELAKGSMTKHLYHHYRGFAENQVRQIGQEDPPRAKSILYLYRVLLTGIHALERHEVEANLV
ncbi:MAG: nucleotidyltransferase domain-containing protein, partial [Planctomycetota bacterium]